MTGIAILRRWFWVWLFGLPLLALAIWGIVDNERLFFATTLNGLTLAALYFLVASGFTLVFGLLRNVNLAHGSLYLLGAYVGWMVGEYSESWLLAVAAGFLFAALMGLLLQIGVFRFMHGQDLRQTMATIALSIIAADVALWIWGGQIYQFDPPRWIIGSTTLPIVGKFATYRLVLLAMAVVIGLALWWFLARTRVGMMIRAGVDDRAMLSASGVNVQMVFAITFAIGAGSRASPAWSAARRCPSRRARTRATCWPRWSWSSSAAWAAWRAPRWAPFSSALPSSSVSPTRRPMASSSPSSS